ncbi:hypothetical protein MicloDRAFT_00051280 [Microvirga lotononidis]|uniref:Uncharacterized protein n=1 Tax=Microvirga lotononidis TaxID=864069 RepID=I4YX50_9HYPH|nr:hypothetical protein MicloDRAFT_00051280 [Microvirga lotononidis]
MKIGRLPAHCLNEGVSVLRHVERNRQKDISGLVDDFEVPAAPVDLVGFAFLPQFLNGFESLIMGGFQIRDFDSCLVDDPFVHVHKMKVAVHDRTILEIFTRQSSRNGSGICR